VEHLGCDATSLMERKNCRREKGPSHSVGESPSRCDQKFEGARLTSRAVEHARGFLL